MDLRGTREWRVGIWQNVARMIEGFFERVPSLPVFPRVSREEIRGRFRRLDIKKGMGSEEALHLVVNGLTEETLQTSHPAYFGVFNPAPTSMGIAADTLVAAFNPQLASWTSAPFAIELEDYLIEVFAEKITGWSVGWCGNFTTGGAEANHTALLLALCRHFSEWETAGLTGLREKPAIYVSTESHHSFLKAARLCGLGTEGVREVPVNEKLQMDAKALQRRIEEDRRRGFFPFFVVGTAGTTGAGTVDALGEIAEVAAREKLWFHVDAAWGGAGCLVPELKPLFSGIERADSITVDAHKWFNVPMGAGMILTRWGEERNRAFRIEASYMPPESRGGGEASQPYLQSIQWSRRFIGLKVFLSVASVGWDGYVEVLRHQVGRGDRLRQLLEERRWEILHPTKLPVVCCVDPNRQDGRSKAFLEKVAKLVAESGRSWLTTTELKGSESALRAGIANYLTQDSDLVALADALDAARKQIHVSG